MNDLDTMTYTYYQKNVKPKPETEGKKGFVCKVCGYIYEGDELPDDFICPLCKHGVADFEPIEYGMSSEEAQQECGRCLRCDHYGFGVFKGGRTTKW